MVYRFAVFVGKWSGQTLGKHLNKDNSLDCDLCEVKFSSKKALRYHKKIKHTVEMNDRYMIFHEIQAEQEREFICKICLIPIKFSKNSIFFSNTL